MTKLTESDAVRVAHHLEEASKYAYALFWAKDIYKDALNEQFRKAFKAAAEAAGYKLVEAEDHPRTLEQADVALHRRAAETGARGGHPSNSDPGFGATGFLIGLQGIPHPSTGGLMGYAISSSSHSGDSYSSSSSSSDSSSSSSYSDSSSSSSFDSGSF